MHVFATALGTGCNRARSRSDFASKPLNLVSANPSDWAAEQSAKLQAIRSAPRSPWHGRGCTYLPWLPRLVIGAMIVGGLGGGILLSGTIGHRTSPEGIIVGAASFAVLGGWISFLGGNFYGVFRHGFREALAEQQKDQTAIGSSKATGGIQDIRRLPSLSRASCEQFAAAASGPHAAKANLAIDFDHWHARIKPFA